MRLRRASATALAYINPVSAASRSARVFAAMVMCLAGICQSGHEHTASAINDEASGEGVIEPWDTCLIFLSSTRTLPDLSRASTPSKTCTFLSRIELGGPLVAPAACCAPAPPVAHRGLFA